MNQPRFQISKIFSNESPTKRKKRKKKKMVDCIHKQIEINVNVNKINASDNHCHVLRVINLKTDDLEKKENRNRSSRRIKRKKHFFFHSLFRLS